MRKTLVTLILTGFFIAAAGLLLKEAWPRMTDHYEKEKQWVDEWYSTDR